MKDGPVSQGTGPLHHHHRRRSADQQQRGRRRAASGRAPGPLGCRRGFEQDPGSARSPALNTSFVEAPVAWGHSCRHGAPLQTGGPSMRHTILAALLAAAAPAAFAAPVPKEQLLVAAGGRNSLCRRVGGREAWRPMGLDASRRFDRVALFAVAARLDHRDRRSDDARRRRPADENRDPRRDPERRRGRDLRDRRRQGRVEEHRGQRRSRRPGKPSIWRRAAPIWPTFR